MTHIDKKDELLKIVKYSIKKMVGGKNQEENAKYDRHIKEHINNLTKKGYDGKKIMNTLRGGDYNNVINSIFAKIADLNNKNEVSMTEAVRVLEANLSQQKLENQQLQASKRGLEADLDAQKQENQRLSVENTDLNNGLSEILNRLEKMNEDTDRVIGSLGNQDMVQTSSQDFSRGVTGE